MALQDELKMVPLKELDMAPESFSCFLWGQVKVNHRSAFDIGLKKIMLFFPFPDYYDNLEWKMCKG